MMKIFDFPNSKKYYLTHPHKFLKELHYSIKGIYQRITKGYRNIDLWNIDTWFFEIMYSMIEDFKKNKTGYPGEMTEEEWDKILDEMILHFKNSLEETCDFKNMYEDIYCSTVVEDWYNKNFKNKKEKNEDGFYVMDMEVKDEYKEIYERYHEIREQKEEYMQEEREKALDMFKKYLSNLWD